MFEAEPPFNPLVPSSWLCGRTMSDEEGASAAPAFLLGASLFRPHGIASKGTELARKEAAKEDTNEVTHLRRYATCYAGPWGHHRGKPIDLERGSGRDSGDELLKLAEATVKLVEAKQAAERAVRGAKQRRAKGESSGTDGLGWVQESLDSELARLSDGSQASSGIFELPSDDSDYEMFFDMGMVTRLTKEQRVEKKARHEARREARRKARNEVR